MKINEESTRERLDGLTPAQKVYIYDGRNVLEFLNRTFIPTSHFIVKDAEIHVRDLVNDDWCDGKKGIRVHTLRLSELYDLYVAFHTAMHYTYQIESRFKFGLIIRRLRYYKNQWEFDVYRVGSAQLWHVAPLLLRTDAPELSKVKAKQAEETVDVKFEDMQSDQEETPAPNELAIEVNEEQTQATVTPIYVEPVPVEETQRVEETQESPSAEEVFFPEDLQPGEAPPNPVDYPEVIDEDLSLIAPTIVETVEEDSEEGEIHEAALTDY